MATFHCHSRCGRADKNSGARHHDYINGIGKYSNKKEVAYSEAGNIPSFATSAKDFFNLADKCERANGRSYRGLVIAIPLEAKPIEWSKNLVHSLVEGQAYSFAVHTPATNNPHLHLMFSERTNTTGLTPQKYFSRSNKKLRSFTEKSWLEQTKKKYLEHIRTVTPSYMPTMKGGKEKQFSPSQPDQIAGAQAERFIKSLEDENNITGGSKMNGHTKDAKGLLHAPSKPPEAETNIFSEGIAWGEVYNPTGEDNTKRSKRLDEDAYKCFPHKHCQYKNPDLVTIWLEDGSILKDHGDKKITVSGGNEKTNAQHLIELAIFKRYKAIELNGDIEFLEHALKEAHSRGLDVSLIDNEQRRIWANILKAHAATSSAELESVDRTNLPLNLADMGARLNAKRAAISQETTNKRKLGL